jgi:hypothetical protein
MFTHDEQKLLQALGFATLSDEQKQKRLDTFYETLHMKVGMAVEETLDEKQLAEFAKVITDGDDTATAAWLQQAIPTYEQLVINSTNELIEDIQRTASELRDDATDSDT